jgi:hypothetical protein
MKKYLFSLLILSFINLHCSSSQKVEQISLPSFLINKIEKLTYGGVSFTGKESTAEFSPIETLKLSASFVKKDNSIALVLQVNVKNHLKNVSIKSFPFKLYYNNDLLYSGNIDHEIKLSPRDSISSFPLNIFFNVNKLAANENYEKTLNSIFALSLSTGISNKLYLTTQPVLEIDDKEYQYPNEISIGSLGFSDFR